MFKQTQSKSRFLAMLLALVMCLGMMPGTAWAADLANISIRGGKYTDSDGTGGTPEISGDTVYIPAGATGLMLDILAPSESGLIFSKDCVTYDGRPNSNCIIISGDCGLTATSASNAQTALALYFSGTAKPGQMDIFFMGFASVDDPYGVASDENGMVIGSNTLHVVVTDSTAPSEPDPKPEEKGFRIDFFPNGGTIKSIRGYESSKIVAGSMLAQEQNIFVDENSGVGMITTGGNGLLDCFPVIERQGYKFDGWYAVGQSQVDSGYAGGEIDLTGAQKVSASTVFTAEAYLAAKWTPVSTETGSVYEIWFHLGGGKVTSVLGVSTSNMTDSKLYDSNGEFIYQELTAGGTELLGEMLTGKDGKLAGFPVIEKEGYIFDGWYTQETGGKKIPGDFDFTGSGDKNQVYLWARWTPAKDTCTVTFSLNGAPGTAPAAQKVAKNGNITMPEDPKWAGHTFLGWVSGDISGNQIVNPIEWTSKTKVTKDVTLYAAWVEDTADSTLKSLTYRFGNYAGAHEYPAGYKIPLERYQLIFGNNELARQLYNRANAWGGSCYGMSTTSAMFSGKLVSTTSFKAGSSVPYDLSISDRNSAWKLTLTQYIEAMQISQKAQRVQKQISENANNLSALCAAVKSAPVIVTMFTGNSGHAVVGYAVKEGTGIQIYDPNYPGQARQITLDGGGSGWSYDGYDMISYVPYAEAAQVWSGRGSEKNYYDTMNLVSISADSATIANSAGKVVATIQDGRATSSQSGVYPIYELDSAAGTSGSAPALWLPTGEYTVTNKDGKSIKVTMTNVDQSAAVTTDASGITFLVDDSKSTNSVRLAGAGKSYDVTLTSTLDKGSREVKLSGRTSADTTVAAQIAGKLYGTNLDAKGTIKVDGKDAGSDVLAGSVPDTTSPAAPEPAAFPFTDVGESRWYRPYVQAAYEAGLVNGVTATTYEPDKTLSLAEAVTLAARIYAEAHGETAPSGGTPWYKAAYDYCVEKGVIDGKSFALTDMPRTATRYEMVSILDGAVPEERMKESVKVAKDGIPDLKESDSYGGVVYRWYRAGLIGGDADGSFNGGRDIKRSEVAKILCTINRLA